MFKSIAQMMITIVLTLFLLLSDESNGSKGTKASPNGVSRWKSILKNIAEQVSQVGSPPLFFFFKYLQDDFFVLFCWIFCNFSSV